MYLTLFHEKVTLVPLQLLVFTVTGFCCYDGVLFLSDTIASGLHGYDRAWLIYSIVIYRPCIMNRTFKLCGSKFYFTMLFE
jgi:hypothetical protein